MNDCGESGWALVLAAHCCALAGSAEKLWLVWSKDGTVLAVLSLAISGRAFFIPSCMNCPPCLSEGERVFLFSLLALPWLPGYSVFRNEQCCSMLCSLGSHVGWKLSGSKSLQWQCDHRTWYILAIVAFCL